MLTDIFVSFNYVNQFLQIISNFSAAHTYILYDYFNDS